VSEESDEAIVRARADLLSGRTVLFLIDNVPYRLDSRVRREASALKEIGASIIVICPSEDHGWRQIVNDVKVYQYPKPALGAGMAAHLIEYCVSLFFLTILTFWVYLRHGFSAIHVANPPDLLWLVAVPYKLLGCKYVFDHHDLVPELYEVRFSQSWPWLLPVVRFLERASIRLSDQVISTNQTFRHIAIERNGKAAPSVAVVRNGPMLSVDFPPTPPDAGIRSLGRVVVGYLGIMNPQDHLDYFLEMAKIIRIDRGREDIGFVMVGSGDAFDDLRRMRDAMGLGDVVRMPGTLPWPAVLSTLGAVDICVQPDPPTKFNKHLTMNKLMEYMALGKAAVAFDMPETRVSGGDAVVYVAPEGPSALADAVVTLADDDNRRAQLGAAARIRVESVLAWEHQSANLQAVYAKLLH
jgi:glycosyltransferase involved in cell wall biosynthesis